MIIVTWGKKNQGYLGKKSTPCFATEKNLFNYASGVVKKFNDFQFKKYGC